MKTVRGTGKLKRRVWVAARATAAVLGAHGVSVAEFRYPSKPVRMIVPVAPGGGADITARALAARLTELSGQQVIIDNRPGAGGIVGLELGARAAPDGYTITQASIGPLTVTPALQKNVPSNSVKDFDPITRAVSALNVLVVHPSLPVNSVKDLIAHAKANPDKLSFGSSGAGRADHLAGEMFNRLAKVQMQHVHLHREMNRILSSPDIQDKLHTLGIVPFPTATPEEFGAYIRSDMKKYAELVKAAGIVAD